jgi:hypothetical protein
MGSLGAGHYFTGRGARGAGDDGNQIGAHSALLAPLPIAASRTGLLGGTVATVGFPDIGLQGFAPKLAKGEIASLSGAGDEKFEDVVN